MGTRGRTSPRPRARPHPFTADPAAGADHNGARVCRCGSVEVASVHRYGPARRYLDAAARAAGERDHDDESEASDGRR